MENEMNYYLLFSSIIFFGVLGGIVNAFRTKKEDANYSKSIIKGVVASFLMPVFLEIIKSDLGRNLTDNLYDFIIFGGLCLIAAIFSDKFIDTIGKKILEKAENAERKAEESNKKVNTIIDRKAEPEEGSESIDNRILKFEEFKQSSTKQSIQKVIESFKNQQYDYRTASGLAKDTGLSRMTINRLLQELKKKEIVESINSGGRTLWTLKV